MNQIRNHNIKTYQIGFQLKKDYQAFSKLDYTITKKDSSSLQLTIQIENEKINQLFSDLAQFTIKNINEIKYDLETYFDSLFLKGGKIAMFISKPLLKQSIKANSSLWGFVTLGLCIIIAVLNLLIGGKDLSSGNVNMSEIGKYITALKLGGEQLYDEALTLSGLFAAMGFGSDLLQLVQSMNINFFVQEMYYALAGIMLPMIFVIVTANKLIASQIDNGSMAYVLSTPTKRITVAFTQLFYLIGALFSMYFIVTFVDTMTRLISAGTVDLANVILLNLGSFIVMIAIAGICFMASCLFNLSKHSLALGGGITVFFFICKILALFGTDSFVSVGMGVEEMQIFNYLTIISLYDTAAITDLNPIFIYKLFILIAIGIITTIVGIYYFNKKDLPL